VRFASVYRRFQEATDFRAGSQKNGRETMIALASDYLLCKMANGETVPFSPENITIRSRSRDCGFI